MVIADAASDIQNVNLHASKGLGQNLLYVGSLHSCEKIDIKARESQCRVHVGIIAVTIGIEFLGLPFWSAHVLTISSRAHWTPTMLRGGSSRAMYPLAARSRSAGRRQDRRARPAFRGARAPK